MKRSYIFGALLFSCCFIIRGNAQTSLFGSGYFQNQYVFNPAMTGLNNKELNLSLSYLRQGNSGGSNTAFTTLYGTADYAFNNAIGAGLSVYNDKAGLISSSKYVGSYSFHMNLADENQRLHLGFSVIGIQQRVRQDGVSGDPGDPAFYNFNKRKMQAEADFGAAYTDKSWTIQATVPNLVSLINDRPRDQIFSQSTLFFASSYKFKLNDDDAESMTLEPKVVYRGFKQTKNVIDVGANFSILNNALNLYGMYHSTKCVTAGVGYKLDFAQVSAAYTTTPSALSGYSLGNQFEINVKFSILNK